MLDVFARDRDYEALAKGLEQMIDSGERFVLVFLQLGNAYRWLGRNQEAVSSFENAIALDPDVYLAQYQYGSALSAVSRYEDAIVAYKKAASLELNRSEPLANAGSCALMLNRPEEAMLLQQQALARNPADRVAKRGLEEARRLKEMSPEERGQIKIIMGRPQ